MTSKNVFFKKDNGLILPVDRERYLFSALSPTSEGTNYWDSPPPAPISDRQTGRILLQIHQILDLFRSTGVDLKGKKMLDIGTGNGMVPRLMLELSELSEAVGSDPFLDGEHQTSWQPHDHEEEFKRIRDYIDRNCPDCIDYGAYQQHAKLENMIFQPQPIVIPPRSSKKYRFDQVGVHNLEEIDDRFDVFYCKAIEHIHDWEKAFASVSAVANPGAIFYLKHRSFFSYMGAHRYASTDIPWGHVLLTDSEFRRYAHEFHESRAEEMCNFFFDGLAYPRNSVSDMMRIANEKGFIVHGVQVEAPRYAKTVSQYIKEIPNFWATVWKNYPRVGADELFSGMIHILLWKK